MRAISSSDLRRNLATNMNRVHADHEPVVIMRGSGKPAAVMMSLEDFTSFEETLYLLSSPRNAKRLRRATRALDAETSTR